MFTVIGHQCIQTSAKKLCNLLDIVTSAIIVKQLIRLIPAEHVFNPIKQMPEKYQAIL
jgi:hypothetical protein